MKPESELEIIRKKPAAITVNGSTVHESVLRSYSIMEHIIKMVERGDSKETIMEVVEDLRFAEQEPLKL